MIDNLNLNKKISAEEMHAIQTTRRLKLCAYLSGFGTIFLLIFTIVSYKRADYLLSYILLTSSLVGILNVFLLLKYKLEKIGTWMVNAVLGTLIIVLIYTGGAENTGLLWIYPMMAVTIFVNNFKTGLLFSIILLSICALMLFTSISELLISDYTLNESIRFEITLMVLSLMCLIAIKTQEKSNKSIIRLYTDDARNFAFTDSLTGLPNRWSIKKEIDRSIENAKKYNSKVSLIYIDLSDFKTINDLYGHDTGDSLLKQFSLKLKNLIQDNFNKNDTFVGRLSGDEFVVVFKRSSLKLVEKTAKKINSLFEDGYLVNSKVHPINVSIGISTYPKDAQNGEDLLYYADSAMSESRKHGNNLYQFFNQDILNSLRKAQDINEGLKNAIKNKNFSLVFMPIINCKTSKMESIEALLRCQEPSLNGIGPDDFIPVAESTGLIKDIDMMVIEMSFQGFLELKEKFNYEGNIAINISGVELKNDYFVSNLMKLVNKYEINTSKIELEVTETALVDDNKKGCVMLHSLKKLGFKISLDDFGTGYTAFNQLMNYPANYLKIDRSFVSELFSEEAGRNKIVEVISNLAKLYNLKIIAEGVETQEQMAYLQNLNCDYAQGYFLSKPLTLEQLKESNFIEKTK